MDEFDKLAIETARLILAWENEAPGSQEPENVQAARQILDAIYSQAGNEIPARETASAAN